MKHLKQEHINDIEEKLDEEGDLVKREVTIVDVNGVTGEETTSSGADSTNTAQSAGSGGAPSSGGVPSLTTTQSQGSGVPNLGGVNTRY